MIILDMNKIVNEILNACYNSENDLHCIPFSKLNEDDGLTELYIFQIKNELDLCNEILVCEIWDDCFYIKVHKYIDTEYDGEESESDRQFLSDAE